jgi:hypothetical protein
LVTIPIRLYPATNTERRIELHQIHEPSGKRIRYQKVAPGVGLVENENVTKGFEYEKVSALVKHTFKCVREGQMQRLVWHSPLSFSCRSQISSSQSDVLS